MTIFVNDESQPLAGSLSELLERMGLNDAVVVTAVNGRFVGLADRRTTPLTLGDRVEILAPMQGG